MAYPLTELNEMSREDFTQALGAIFESTPIIAQRAWNQSPFVDINDLHQKMIAVVDAMSIDEQLALIKAHPDLGSKAKMAPASVQEQAGVGLDKLTPQQYEKFRYLNAAYKQKFDFPFIIAVKNHTLASILENFEQRLNNSRSTEIETAIAEINQIAYFRLQDTVIC